MPRRTPGKHAPDPSVLQAPRYRLHKRSGRAVVTLTGRDYYLGPHGSPESRAAYSQLIGLWLANGRRLPPDKVPAPWTRPSATAPAAPPLAVVELLERYVAHCKVAYATRRCRDSFIGQLATVTRTTRELFGFIDAAAFGPKALQAVRERWVRAGLARKSVNEYTRILKAAFRWGVAEELVPAGTWEALRAVGGLRLGQSAAREPEKIKPVPDAHVDAVLPHLLPPVRAMIQVQRLTGMRPGELCIMRTHDIDMNGKVWMYRPSAHKTEHHGHEREVAIGPQAQAVLRPWLRMNVDEYIFRPDEAVAASRAERHRRRRTPIRHGNHPGTNRRANPRRSPRDRYDVGAYRRAIERACDQADREARPAAGQPECRGCAGRGQIVVDEVSQRCPVCGGTGMSGEPTPRDLPGTHRACRDWREHMSRALAPCPHPY